MHKTCLEKNVKELNKDIQLLLHKDSIHNYTDEKSNEIECLIDGACYYCINQIAECFECKKLDKIGIDVNLEDREIANDFVHKCSVCPKFFHLRCLPELKIVKNTYRCSVHYCKECNEYSRRLYSCIKCPISFHKKCLPKNNKIIKINVILCKKHKMDRLKGKNEGSNKKSAKGNKSNKKKTKSENGKKIKKKSSKNKSKNVIESVKVS